MENDEEQENLLDGEDCLVTHNDHDIRGGGVRRLSIDKAIETAGFGRFHIFMVIVMGWANSADTIELLSISFVLPQASCELHATDLELGFLTAVGFAGMIIGSYFWGTFADIKGRIKALLLCQLVNAVFIVLSSVSQNLPFLICMRLFSGFGVGGTAPLIFVYVVEILPAKHRGKMTAVLSFCFMVGQILVAGMAWLILPHTEWTWTTSTGFTYNSWRIFMLLSSLPVISSFFMFFSFPESPRHLIQVGRVEDAKAVIKRIYEKNGNARPYDENYIITHQRGSNSRGSMKEILSGVGRNTVALVTRPKVRFRFLISSIVLFCLSFSYYGLTMWFPTLLERMEASQGTSVCDDKLPAANTSKCDGDLSNNAVYFDTFLQAVSSLPGNVLYFLLVDVIGRKLLTGVSMILTGISVFFIWFVSSHTGSIVLSCVFAGVSVVSWNATSLLTTEIFPTELRSTAKGVQGALANRVASVLATLVFGALVSTYCAVPILLMSCLLISGGIITYKLPNTANASIE